MTSWTTIDAYGVLTEPMTLKIQRLLPGPVERVWAYLTDSDKRRQWLAAGDMNLAVGAPFQLTWRNDNLMDDPGQRPEGSSEEHSMDSQITELEPLRKLGFSWGSTGGVTFELEAQGNEVLLTIVHHRLPNRDLLLKVAAGWHAHLDVLAAKASGETPPKFWDHWQALVADYDQRIPA
jgi:uncharacterized protein YndB with AHSA1/START domain